MDLKSLMRVSHNYYKTPSNTLQVKLIKIQAEFSAEIEKIIEKNVKALRKDLIKIID